MIFLFFIFLRLAVTVRASTSDNTTMISQWIPNSIAQEVEKVESWENKAASLNSNHRWIKKDFKKRGDVWDFTFKPKLPEPVIHLPLNRLNLVADSIANDLRMPDSVYVADIAIGEQRTFLRFEIDISSQKSWAYDDQLTNILSERWPFDSKSTKYVADYYEIKSERIGGVLLSDTFYLPDFPVQHDYVLADELPEMYFDAKIDGKLSLLKGEGNILGDLNRHGVLPIYGLYLSSSIRYLSTLMLGGFDKTKANGLKFTDLNQEEPFWSVPIDVFVINNNLIDMPTLPSIGILNTTTNNISGPENVVEAIYSYIDGYKRYPDNKRYFTFPKSARIALEIGINGVLYHIKREDIMVTVKLDEEHKIQIGTIIVNHPSDIDQSQHVWTLGTAFLRNVYTVFDLVENRIGFSSLSQDKEDKRRKYYRNYYHAKRKKKQKA